MRGNMTRKEFRELASRRYLYLDGATGSNLMKAGMPSGVCPEQWILEHREVMLRLQREYVEAGTDILYCPTFTANRIKLEEYHLADRMEEMIRELVGISKEAAERKGEENFLARETAAEKGLAIEEIAEDAPAAGNWLAEGASAAGNGIAEKVSIAGNWLAEGAPAAGAGSAKKVWIAGDLTMTGRQLRPQGTMELEDLIDVYKEQIRIMAEAGVDLLVVETMMSLQEARAALIAAKEVCDLPVMVTLTFEQSGRTLFGTDALTASVCLEALGASAVGANCSTGPAAMEEVIRTMAEAVHIPVIAKPNAGLPMADASGNTRYDMDAETFGEEMKLLAGAGATVLGGCCGTSPEYIRRLRLAMKEIPFSRPEPTTGLHYLTSERRTLAFSLDQGFFVVGERINPTGKKALQAQLREGNFDMVVRFAEEQTACGAQVLDINMGMSGIDEKAMMLQAIEEVAGVTDLPLSLDSSHVEVLEEALRRYPGRALINSISLEKEKYEKLLPLAAKYGAMFILLPLSDRGLPENLDEKKEIIRRIVNRALELGLKKEDIVVDGLVTTVGANKKAALETLETIRFCREQGLATICGLSNISFGLPERSFVNAAFLTLAIEAGLTMAIANPSQELLMGCSLAADLLLNKEGADLRYIEFAGALREVREKEAARQASEPRRVPGDRQSSGFRQDSGSCQVSGLPQGQATEGAVPGQSAELPQGQATLRPTEKRQISGSTQSSSSSEPPVEGSSARQEVFQAVLRGNRKGIVSLVQKALEQGEEASALLNQVLLPAINQVGEYFDRGKYFLPQLIGSAEAMKSAIEVLEPLLMQEQSGEEMPVVVIATVEGDIHDIGKNLVALMLKNYGFQVIDLGKDVPARRIIEAAREHHARIIGLSALMTTTMQRMKEVIALAREEGLPVKIMIGGAVVTPEYAEEIGADGYSADAAEAVRVAKELLTEEF